MNLASPSPLNRSDRVASPTNIPMPSRRWLTRIGVPGAIVLASLTLLAISGRQALLPSTKVTIIRAIGKPRSADVTTSSASPVSTSPATVASVVVQAPGWIEPDPFPIRVPALAEGVLKEVLVLEGAHVAAEQIVARMIDDDAKLSLRRAQAEMDRREALLAAAQSQWDHPIDRERAITTAQANIAQIEAELATAEARIATDAAKTAELQSLLHRMQSLPDSFVSEFELERTRLQLDASKASLDATRKQKVEVQARAISAEGDLLAAKESLRLRIEEKRELAEAKALHLDAVAAFDQATLQLSRMEIRAQAPGIVMFRNAAPGMRMMTTGDMAQMSYVVDLYNPRKLQVRTDIPLSEAAKVGVGQLAQIVVDVLPDRIFTGRVTRLVHQADIGKNTIQVKVAIDDPVEAIKPEMLAKVKFFSQQPGTSTSTAANPAASSIMTFVPRSLLITKGGGNAVWLMNSDSLATLKNVTTGSVTIEDWIEITQGVQVNDALITNFEGLREGDRVRANDEKTMVVRP